MVAAPGNADRMYRRLEVQPEASADQIRHAYRRLAHALHPDANPEDPDAARRFREVTEAYDILSSTERRARYDQARRPATPPVSWSIPTVRGGSVVPGGAPRGHRVSEAGPTVIGAGRLPGAWPPLVAGPVRVAPPGVTPGDHRPDPVADEFRQLIEAVLSWWRSH